jgi:Cof subfamily protein (haloacid dehalogenase superfamily)
MVMPIKLIVTDLDNTLLRRDKTFSGYSTHVFECCRKRGILFVFATARPKVLVTEYIEVLKPDALILTNGAILEIAGEVVSDGIIPDTIVSSFLSALIQRTDVRRITARGRVFSYTNDMTRVDDLIDPRRFSDYTAPLPEPILHLSARCGDNEFMCALANKYPEIVMWHVSGSDLYDVNLATATKWSGVRSVATRFNIPTESVAAFGDDYKDVEMLRECGVGVAVANALDEVKAVADYICDDCDDDGVARWIEANVL